MTKKDRPAAYACDSTHAERRRMTALVEDFAADRLVGSLFVEVCADPTCAKVFATCNHERCAPPKKSGQRNCLLCQVKVMD